MSRSSVTTVLLLALAEHIGYGFAYLIAAGAISLMVAFYIGAALKSRFAGMIMVLVMAAVLLVLFDSVPAFLDNLGLGAGFQGHG